MKNNILYISPNFNYACGVSKHVYTLLTSEELKKEFNLYLITNCGDALAKLDNACIDYSLIDFKTNKIIHYDFFRNLKQIKKFCREKKIDIIHSHHRYPDFLTNNLKEALGIKTVVTVHNIVTGYKIISYKSDIIVAISNSIKNHLVEYYKLRNRKIEVLYNCISSDIDFKLKAETVKSILRIPQNSKVLLYVGRMTKEKGVTVLLKSFDIIFNEFNDTFLVLIGDERHFGKLNSNRIISLPAQESITQYYLIADILILPSYSEGLGYTMLEAGLFKIPFIGSKAGGISEFIEDEVNGYLFEPGNVKGLANRIEYVLTHPKEALASAEKLHEKVRKECNCEHYFKKLSSIYSNLLEK
jgi:glycosyltransferase involved in cell wall biosynthesis